MINANNFVVKKETSESSGYVIKSMSTRAIGPGGCVLVQIEEERRLAFVKDQQDFLVAEIPPKVYHVPVFPTPAVKPELAENCTNTENNTQCCSTQTEPCKPCESKEDNSTTDKVEKVKKSKQTKKKKVQRTRRRRRSCTSDYTSDSSSYDSCSESDGDTDCDCCDKKKHLFFNLQPEYVDYGCIEAQRENPSADCRNPQTQTMDWESGNTNSPHTEMDWDSSQANPKKPNSDTEMFDTGSSSCWCEHESETTIPIITIDIRASNVDIHKQN